MIDVCSLIRDGVSTSRLACMIDVRFFIPDRVSTSRLAWKRFTGSMRVS
jgi:hypothetical protein